MGKELCHCHKVTKDVTSVTEWLHHMLYVIVTICDRVVT